MSWSDGDTLLPRRFPYNVGLTHTHTLHVREATQTHTRSVITHILTEVKKINNNDKKKYMNIMNTCNPCLFSTHKVFAFEKFHHN